MAADYTILTCRKTLEFSRWAESYGLWIPLVKTQRVVNGQVVERVAAALAGYAFVPQYHWPELRRRCPSLYSARVFGYDLVGRPRTCTLAALELMQATINAPDPEPEAAKPLEFGTQVKITCGPFAGMFGVVSRCRSGKVRLMLGIHYVVMPISYVEPIK